MAVKKLMKQILKNNDSIWNLKEITLWAREFAYTPTVDFSFQKQIHNNIPVEDTYSETSSDFDELQKWIKDSSKNNDRYNCDEEINVVDDEPAIKTDLNTLENLRENEVHSTIILENSSDEQNLENYVQKTAYSIGIKLCSEEIIPGVSHNSSSYLIAKVYHTYKKF